MGRWGAETAREEEEEECAVGMGGGRGGEVADGK